MFSGEKKSIPVGYDFHLKPLTGRFGPVGRFWYDFRQVCEPEIQIWRILDLLGSVEGFEKNVCLTHNFFHLIFL